ncbi:MAG TPA: hypothetical protein PK509_05500 [Catalimonadaceae bacterium]|nr:hypothetical protein [Catalimonadaceae bacterium]HPI12513.1 hypothetical protein [Catalimonadaceae bacterium]
MKKVVLVLILGFMPFLFVKSQCLHCDVDKVKMVNENLRHLTIQQIRDFLCAFDSSCKSNAEYSEWSNEVLFKVLEKAPSLFFQVIAEGNVDVKILIGEIENPFPDVNTEIISNAVSQASAPTNLKEVFLKALANAKRKSQKSSKE